jgi:ornithine cyclodeaminase/alanine dehydrogenase-like protein (mu-crystallin family)
MPTGPCCRSRADDISSAGHIGLSGSEDVAVTAELGVRILSSADVSAILTPELAIASQQRAFEHLGRGLALLPARLVVGGPEDSAAFCYAARLDATGPAVCKFGSVNPANGGRGLPSIAALITVLDAATGRPIAIMDGTAITTLRTSAASALAVQMLAAPQSDTLTVLGAGVQAAAHVETIAKVLRLASVRIWSPQPSHRESLAGRLAGAGAAGNGVPVVATVRADDAVLGADVVVCCTTSREPVLQTGWLKPGATVISLGSYAPGRCEVPQDLLTRAALIVVDDVDTAVQQAGPIVSGLAAGVLSRERLVPFGKIVAGLAAGRESPADIVYFNSIGIGVQDAAAAVAIVDAARARGAGHQVTF